MNSRDTIKNLRERGSFASPQAAPKTQSFAILPIIALAAFIAVAGVGSFIGATHFFAPKAPPVQWNGPPTDLVVLARSAGPEAYVWDKKDTETCRAAVNKQADADDREADRVWRGDGTVLPSMAGNASQSAANMECIAVTKPLRLCNEKDRRAMVTHVRIYMDKFAVHMRKANPDERGVDPMATQMGVDGEAMTTRALEVMEARALAGYDKVSTAVRTLAESSLIAEVDFGGWFGAGTPAWATALFKGVTVKGDACKP
jgi:hypothetical protein